jgi:hypothetical protein
VFSFITRFINPFNQLHMRKIYNPFKKIISGIRPVMILSLALIVFSGTAYSQTTYTLNYTGSIQTLTLQAGIYGIKMWGADGGNSNNSRAGIGGYSQGTLTLASSTTLYIVVGGSPIYTGSSGLQPGGYNGGGSGYANATGRAGGGATHIATLTGVLSALASSTSAVIIVAGGGGGDQNAGLIGHGGGLSGGGSYPGTQTGSSGSAAGLFGSFGQGGNITASYGGGGGGGWYGGGGNQNNAGSGGSGYIGGVTNGVTTMSGTTSFVTKPIAAMDGLVIIESLCSVQITSSGSNSLAPAICAGQSVTLTTTAASNYTWSNGNTTSTSIVVSPSSTTSYSIVGTSTANCQAAGNIIVTVNSAAPQLTVTSVPPGSVCLGQSATISASGAVTYTWNNTITNGQSFLPTSTQTYVVTGQNGCGTSTAAIALTVAPLPVSILSSPATICYGSTSALSATSAATGYTWQPGGLTGSLTGASPTVTTIYTVAVTDGTCAGTNTVQVAVNPIPTITAVGSSSSICAGDLVNITAFGGINYTWTPGNQPGSTFSINPNTSIAVNVTGDNSFGCTSSAIWVIIVNASPTINITSNKTTVCENAQAVLTAAGANTYTWNNNQGQTGTQITVNPSVTSTYSVVGTNTTSGCTGTKTISINVYKPVINTGGPGTICNGAVATLTASGATGNYTWTGGPQSPINLVTPSVTTVYTVSAISSSLGATCVGTATILVTVNQNPILNASGTNTICKGQSTSITVSGASTYTWSNGSNLTSITVTPAVTTPYTVNGTDANGCEGSTSISVKVNPCTGIDENSGLQNSISVYPNPNNGEFIIESAGNVSLTITNELGQTVKEINLTDLNDHKVSVTDLSAGIYFIRAEGDQTINKKIIIH